MSGEAFAYEHLGGDLHRHGGLIHSHHHHGPHGHDDDGPDAHSHGHGHSHGLLDESIKRSRAGLRAVLLSLAVLALAATAQTAIFLASGSVALLIGLAITAVILRITWDSWRTVHGHPHHHEH